MSDSLQPHGPQHARPPCPSPTPGVYSNSCPLSQWCHPTISFLCRPLLLLPSIFPRIRVFSNEPVLHIMWPKYWSFSFSISASQWIFRTDFLQDWLVLSPCSRKDSQESSPTPQFRSINSLVLSFLIVQISHLYMITEKTIALTRQIFVGKVMSLLFNMLSRFVIAFLPRSKRLLISWL